MLALENVQVNIRTLKILRRVSLEVEAGQVVGLVGRNGAGKTTTLKSVIGLMPVSSGSVKFDGANLLQVPAYKRAGLGIGYMPEDRRLMAMGAEENVRLPAWALGLSGILDRLKRIYHHMPEVQELANRPATQLSGGQQKMVALARALMTGTKLLLLDEPFEGLAPAMSEKLSQVIQGVQERRIAVLIAESNHEAVQDLAQKVYTIERGEILDATDET